MSSKGSYKDDGVIKEHEDREEDTGNLQEMASPVGPEILVKSRRTNAETLPHEAVTIENRTAADNTASIEK